jgi:hypothetical protein
MDQNTLIDSQNVAAFVPTHAFFIEKQAMGLIWQVDKYQVDKYQGTTLRFTQKTTHSRAEAKYRFTCSILYRYETHSKTHYDVMLPVLTELAHDAHLRYSYTLKSQNKKGEIVAEFEVKDERAE